MQSTKGQTEYELMELQDRIPVESIICNGIQMKYSWDFKRQLLTSEQLITNLHKEIKLQEHEMTSLPLQWTVHRVLDFNVLLQP